jgi:two-component system NtrC family sensor kinase
MSVKTTIPGPELASFLRRDALELCERAGFDVEVALVARAAPDPGADGGERGEGEEPAGEVRRRLRDGRGNVELLQRMAALGELGAGVLHEVRNVLTGVRGFGQIALRRPDRDARDHLQIIARETERAIELLTRYLDLSRAGGERLGPVGSHELIESAAMLVRHRFHMARVPLVVDLGPDSLLTGHAQELAQVLVNLLINALQVSAAEAVVRIGAVVRGEGGASWLDVTVTDHGPGIAPQHRARLFEPFFTTKPAGEGIGLGLAVSRGIVQRHGGSIAVESAPGAGAAFTVRLPLATAAAGGGEDGE